MSPHVTPLSACLSTHFPRPAREETGSGQSRACPGSEILPAAVSLVPGPHHGPVGGCPCDTEALTLSSGMERPRETTASLQCIPTQRAPTWRAHTCRDAHLEGSSLEDTHLKGTYLHRGIPEGCTPGCTTCGDTYRRAHTWRMHTWRCTSGSSFHGHPHGCAHQWGSHPPPPRQHRPPGPWPLCIPAGILQGSQQLLSGLGVSSAQGCHQEVCIIEQQDMVSAVLLGYRQDIPPPVTHRHP